MKKLQNFEPKTYPMVQNAIFTIKIALFERSESDSWLHTHHPKIFHIILGCIGIVMNHHYTIGYIPLKNCLANQDLQSIVNHHYMGKYHQSD